MNQDQVAELLKDYRCYKFALQNVKMEYNNIVQNNYVPIVFSERSSNPDLWDYTRYTKVLGLLDIAINEVLSDNHRTVIMRKYIDRNPMNLNEIAEIIKCDRTTVGRWHKEALRKLAIAVGPMTSDEMEFTSFNHMFDEKGKFRYQPA